MSEPDLHRQLISILAGLAGERMAFGNHSTSVNDDLHAATALARSMVTSFGMSPALGLVTIGEKSGEVFLGASLQDLGSVGPHTLNVIDDEVERLVGDAEARAAVILDRNWSTVEETATALLEQETLSGRGAGGGALHRAGGHARGAARRAPRSTTPPRFTTRGDPSRRSERSAAQSSPAALGHAATPGRCDEGASPAALAAMVVALIALVFSTTGLADAARHAVVAAIAGHPISSKPHAGGLLTLGQQREIPLRGDPHRGLAETPSASTAKRPSRSSPPARPTRSTSAPGAWNRRPSRSPTRTLGKNNFIWASKKCEEEGGWLPSAARAARRRRAREARVDDPRLAADRHDQPRPEPRPQRRTRDELRRWSQPKRAPRRPASRGSAKAPRATPVRASPTRSRCPPTRCRNRCSTWTSTANGTKGGFAGSQPVNEPQNFRCAYAAVARGPQ